MGILDFLFKAVNNAEITSAAFTGSVPTKNVKKGSKGENVKRVQRFLNWNLGTKLAVDGKCGSKTVSAIKKFQKKYKLKVDGVFGPQCRKKMQSLIKPTPKPAPAPTPKPTPTSGASKLIAKANEYCWPYGTSSSKYSYSKGSAKPAYKSALKKYMKKTAKVSQSDCGYFVSTCVRAAGISSNFLALPAKPSNKYPAVPSTMKIVHKGKAIPSGLLQPGDIIRYRKTSSQHAMMFYGNGKIAEAGRSHWFPAIKKDTKKYNKSNVKKSTIQVLRVKG